MWWLIAEAALALVLLVAMVAWTMSGRRREDGDSDGPGDSGR